MVKFENHTNGDTINFYEEDLAPKTAVKCIASEAIPIPYMEITSETGTQYNGKFSVHNQVHVYLALMQMFRNNCV